MILSALWNNVHKNVLIWLCDPRSTNNIFCTYHAIIKYRQHCKKNAASRVRTYSTSNDIIHKHEANMRFGINKRDTCGLPAAYKRLRLIVL
jgi:hypothetical protein